MSGFLSVYGFPENPNQLQNYQQQQPHPRHSHRLDPDRVFETHDIYNQHQRPSPPLPSIPTYGSSGFGRDSVIASSASDIADKVIDGHLDSDHLDMMKTYFHSDSGDTILFRSWVLRSSWDTFLTCVAFLLLAVLYEGIKCYREHLYKRLSFAVKKEVPVTSSTNTVTRGNVTNGLPSSAKVTLGAPIQNESTINPRIFSVPHLIQSGLHVTQVVLSYSLMLAFMSFNVWVCTSILLGAGLGYFLFYWRKITIVHVTDCH